MRILLWSDLFRPYLGGIETQAARLLPLLQEKGFTFLIVTSHHNLALADREEWQGMTIRRFSFRKLLMDKDLEGLLRMQREVRKCIEEFSPDVVHLNGIGPSSLVFPAATKHLDRPLLVSLHQEVLNSRKQGNETMLYQLLARADHVHAVSPAVLQQFSAILPGLEQKSTVIHNFLDAPDRPPGALPDHPPRLLCLGRLVPQKGFDLALAAVALLKGRFPQLLLTVAGDGQERSRLEMMAGDLDVADRVEFTGWVAPAEVPALINRSTVVLMPSRYEGFGIVAAEAALMGRPVVAARVGGLADVVEHGQTGYLVEPDQPEALADSIARLLSDFDAAVAMGNTARERALRLYDRETIVSEHESLYRRLHRGRS